MRAYYDNVAEQFQLVAIRRIMSLQKLLPVSVLLLFVAMGSGCAYRATISQGNLIDQENLDQVEVGMTRSQIRFLLGTPMIDDPFHADRWDYVYYLKRGRKDAEQQRWVSVFFEDEIVSEVRKDQTLSGKL